MSKGKKKKKVNPRRKHATEADVKKAKRTATADAVGYAWAILFTVLRDKEGYKADDLKRMWAEVGKLSEEINEGRVSVSDLKNTLKEEIGAVLK